MDQASVNLHAPNFNFGLDNICSDSLQQSSTANHILQSDFHFSNTGFFENPDFSNYFAGPLAGKSLIKYPGFFENPDTSNIFLGPLSVRKIGFRL